MRLIDADNLKTIFTSGIRVYEGKCSVTGIIHNIDNAPTVNPNKWISVDEDLPPIKDHHCSDDVLVFTSEGYVGISHLEENAFGGKIFSCERSPLGDRDVEVTHWMPLPSPPKEEKHNE